MSLHGSHALTPEVPVSLMLDPMSNPAKWSAKV